MESEETLNTLLEQAGQYHPDYGVGFSVHLPMVMIALNRLNAPASKLVSTYNHSIKKLQKIDSLDKVSAVSSIEASLGDTESYTKYLKYYTQELEAQGAEAVLRHALPILVKGIAASAFHALIRLAYAIEANSQSEMAVALAYWSARYQPFDLTLSSASTSAKETEGDLEDILTELSQMSEKHEFGPGIIVDRMSEIGTILQREQHKVLPQKLDLTRLREFVLKVFYLQDDFTLLHTVTGCHAFSIIQPYLSLSDSEAALTELWKAILIAYLSTGLKFTDQQPDTSLAVCDFSPIINQAQLSDEAHVIKLVYTCYCEYQKWSNPLYFLVAQRAVNNN